MDRYQTTHVPKVANYGVHPGTTAGTVRPKNRSDLMTKQRQPPQVQGQGAYTTSSVHPSHSRQDLGGQAPAEQDGAGRAQHHYNPTEDAQPYANYVGNLHEQINVLDAQVSMYKAGGAGPSGSDHAPPAAPIRTSAPLQTVGRNVSNAAGVKKQPAPVAGSATRFAKAGPGAASGVNSSRAARGAGRNATGGVSTPMMEVHETNLLETLHKDAQASMDEAENARSALEGERRQAGLLKQELHQARQVAASERNSAVNAAKERDQALTDARTFEHQFNETQGTVDQLHRRFDFAMEELNSVKQELDVSRATSRMKRGCGAPGEEQGGCVGSVGQLEPLQAQIAELQEQIHTKDQRIEDLLECNERAVADQTKSYNALRHEEQKLQMFTAEKESARCLLRETEAEAALLRTENNALKEEVERLSKRSEELGHRFQKELDCRSLRDNHMNQALDTNKVLQQEVQQLHCCYNAEKNVNIEVRAELDSQKRLSDDLRRQLKASQDRYADMQKCCAQMEGNYRDNMANFQHSMSQFQVNHQALVSNENKQLGATMNMLRMMQQDIDEVAKGSTCAKAHQHPSDAAESYSQGEATSSESATKPSVVGGPVGAEPVAPPAVTSVPLLSPPSVPAADDVPVVVDVTNRRSSSPVDLQNTVSGGPSYTSTTAAANRRDGVKTPPIPASGLTPVESAPAPPASRSAPGAGSAELSQSSSAMQQAEAARKDAAEAAALANQAMATPSIAMATPSA